MENQPLSYGIAFAAIASRMVLASLKILHSSVSPLVLASFLLLGSVASVAAYGHTHCKGTCTSDDGNSTSESEEAPSEDAVTSDEVAFKSPDPLEKVLEPADLKLLTKLNDENGEMTEEEMESLRKSLAEAADALGEGESETKELIEKAENLLADRVRKLSQSYFKSIADALSPQSRQIKVQGYAPGSPTASDFSGQKGKDGLVRVEMGSGDSKKKVVHSFTADELGDRKPQALGNITVSGEGIATQQHQAVSIEGETYVKIKAGESDRYVHYRFADFAPTGQSTANAESTKAEAIADQAVQLVETARGARKALVEAATTGSLKPIQAVAHQMGSDFTGLVSASLQSRQSMALVPVGEPIDPARPASRGPMGTDSCAGGVCKASPSGMSGSGGSVPETAPPTRASWAQSIQISDKVANDSRYGAAVQNALRDSGTALAAAKTLFTTGDYMTDATQSAWVYSELEKPDFTEAKAKTLLERFAANSQSSCPSCWFGLVYGRPVGAP